MPLHDYKCSACGHTERNLYFPITDVPKVRECPECKAAESRQIFDQFGRAQIHLHNPTLYNDRIHPQFGVPIRSYNEKLALMKKYGVEEASDPVGGNRKLSEEVFHDESQPEPDDGGVIWNDAQEMKEQLKRYRPDETELGIGKP